MAEMPGPGDYDINANMDLNSIYISKNKNTMIKEMRNKIFGKKNRIAENFNKNNSLHRSYYEKRHSTLEDKAGPCLMEN